MKDLFKDGLMINGKSYKLDIHSEDSQIDPNKAGELASKLILDDGVDLILVGGTPETTNPVSDQAEANGVPAVASVVPWQPWFFRQADADPAKGYEVDVRHVLGLGRRRGQLPRHLGLPSRRTRSRAGLFPNDGDGNAWGDAPEGVPVGHRAEGLQDHRPRAATRTGRTTSAPRSLQFKQAGRGDPHGVPIPPDFATFSNTS